MYLMRMPFINNSSFESGTFLPLASCDGKTFKLKEIQPRRFGKYVNYVLIFYGYFKTETNFMGTY